MRRSFLLFCCFFVAFGSPGARAQVAESADAGGIVVTVGGLIERLKVDGAVDSDVGCEVDGLWMASPLYSATIE